MRDCYYFACDRCHTPLCTIVENPSGHVRCSNCRHTSFHKITKAEYAHVKGMEKGK